MSRVTRAIVCHDALSNKGWSLDEVQVREPQAGELLVRMTASGICHTDVLAGDSPPDSASALYPRVLGQEGSGYVVSIGPGVKIAKPGDAVVLSFASCQECLLCKSGHDSYCQEFESLNTKGNSTFSNDGSDDISGKFFGQSSLADLSIVDQSSVVNISSLVPSKSEMCLFSALGSNLQAGSGATINVAKAGPEDSVVVIGIGAVGLASVMAAKNISNCKRVICVDKLPPRLELANEIGATHLINGDDLPPGKTLEEAIFELTDGLGSTITIETTGSPPLVPLGLACTRRGGKYIPISPSSPGLSLELPWHEFMKSGKQILSAFQGQARPREHIPKMIKWYRDGLFPIEKVSKIYSAERYSEAIDEMYEGIAPKPILTW